MDKFAQNRLRQRKHYRNLNRIVGQSREVIYRAYDSGYKAGREDYEKPTTTLTPEYVEGGMQFRCENCKRAMIANYTFCPYCGCEVK